MVFHICQGDLMVPLPNPACLMARRKFKLWQQAFRQNRASVKWMTAIQRGGRSGTSSGDCDEEPCLKRMVSEPQKSGTVEPSLTTAMMQYNAEGNSMLGEDRCDAANIFISRTHQYPRLAAIPQKHLDQESSRTALGRGILARGRVQGNRGYRKVSHQSVLPQPKVEVSPVFPIDIDISQRTP